MKKTSLESNENTSDSRLIVRAIMIIESVSSSREHQGVHQLSKLTGIHPTTVFRICRTLCKYGWLIQDADSKYGIGMSVYSVGCQFNPVNDLKEVAVYSMQQLSDTTRQPVNLMVRQDNMCLLIQQTHSKNVFHNMSIIGSKMPLYISACGKILLSGISDTLLELILDSFDYHQYTPNTIGNRDEVRRQVKQTRATGLARDDQESVWGTCCIAMPVHDELGGIIAALSVSTVVDFQKNQDEYVAGLKASAQKISNDLIAHRKEHGFLTAVAQSARYRSGE
jgi:DNA-binding IclR family transcriptional regulator